MRGLTELQKAVLAEAKNRLTSMDWFKGVCMDHFPTDRDISEMGVSVCAHIVVMETEMWDSPHNA